MCVSEWRGDPGSDIINAAQVEYSDTTDFCYSVCEYDNVSKQRIELNMFH